MATISRELGKLGFEERCVAFMDFLGFRKLVEEVERDASRAERLLRDLRAPRELYDHLAPHFSRPGEAPFRITAFSDSIVISASHPYLVTHVASSFYSASLYRGMFVRGGIAIGPLYHDDQLVLGSAMIRAYEIEATIARVPRVVVDADVLRSAQSIPTPRGVDAGTLMIQDLLSRDGDGEWMLDPFAKDPTLGGTCPDWRSVVRTRVDAELTRASKDGREELVEKYTWLSARRNAPASTG
jgi:hypothetical protein